MMRSAWVMKLKPGQEAEYKRKHDEIWPEMVALLKSQGVSNYSIYRYENLLFAYLEKPDGAPSQTEGVDPVVLKWWKWMEPHMETHEDARPKSWPVEEMFRLD